MQINRFENKHMQYYNYVVTLHNNARHFSASYLKLLKFKLDPWPAIVLCVVIPSTSPELAYRTYTSKAVILIIIFTVSLTQ